jgi:signal transduction histidine kinase
LFEYQGLHLDSLVAADSKLLGQLFYNLANNAAEANPGRPIKVFFRVERRDHVVGIRVGNNGAVIPDDLVDRIFAVHVSTKAETGKSNMGLGLAIAKKIALDHGGDLVLVGNHDSDGVVFELELPLIS